MTSWPLLNVNRALIVAEAVEPSVATEAYTVSRGLKIEIALDTDLSGRIDLPTSNPVTRNTTTGAGGGGNGAGAGASAFLHPAALTRPAVRTVAIEEMIRIGELSGQASGTLRT